MKELPEELTPELLGLVLGKEVGNDVRKVYYNPSNSILLLNNNNIQVPPNHITIGYWQNCVLNSGTDVSGIDYYNINIDTLTRLMKEWCMETTKLSIRSRLTLSMNWECRIKISNKVRFSTSNEAIYTELEAVLKATHWVAKEKGLIDE